MLFVPHGLAPFTGPRSSPLPSVFATTIHSTKHSPTTTLLCESVSMWIAHVSKGTPRVLFEPKAYFIPKFIASSARTSAALISPHSIETQTPASASFLFFLSFLLQAGNRHFAWKPALGKLGNGICFFSFYYTLRI